MAPQGKRILRPEATKHAEKMARRLRAVGGLNGEATSGTVESTIEELRPRTAAATMAPPQQQAGKKPEFKPEILSSLAFRVAKQMVKKQFQPAARLQADVKNLSDERDQLKAEIAGWKEVHETGLVYQQKNTKLIAELLEENKNLAVENAKPKFNLCKLRKGKEAQSDAGLEDEDATFD